MSILVLTLRAVLLQGLFLVITIVIESLFLQINLRISRKTSVEYATSINLFSMICGWVIFFLAQPLLPERLKIQLMNYIFFNRLLSSESNFWLLHVEFYFLVFLSFIFVFITEMMGLLFLQAMLFKPAEAANNSLKSSALPLVEAVRSNLLTHKTHRATAILSANAVSYSSILMILFLKSWVAGS